MSQPRFAAVWLAAVLATTAGPRWLPAAETLPARRPAGVPDWLPRYELDVQLDVAGHQAKVRQRVTWINRHDRPAAEVVFNAHARYQIADDDVGFFAKTLEILRMKPSECLDFGGQPLEIQQVRCGETVLPFHWGKDNQTALVVPLPRPLAKGEAIALDLDFTLRLPQKQGRWGQWLGVTFLSNWNPVVAVYDDTGWQPTPFIPWHQPWFNEAGIYTVRVTLPADQRYTCTGSVVAEKELGDGRRQVDISAVGVRDFAFLCSARYIEYTNMAGPVKVRCLAFPEHEYYARVMLQTVCEALPVYNQWIGPYPYPEFSFVESYFGWNGNECGTLVMIDERIFGAPHVGHRYFEYLIAHELCHQWWYNLIGTNGYCETWMDEGMATYFSHRFMDRKYGRNNALFEYPRGLEWLPNVSREDYRSYGLYGTQGRGELCPTVQEMPKFGHIVNLLTMCYDKGSRVVGMIEDRLGEAAFLDFIHLIYNKYQYRILRVADFRAELEAYTGRSWKEFFDHWLYDAGLVDWCLEKVKLEALPQPRMGEDDGKKGFLGALKRSKERPYHARITLCQKGEFTDQTVLGICLDGSEEYQVRLPIIPGAAPLEIADPPAQIVTLPDGRVQVDVVLPCKPTQIAVDPDHILVDHNPTNNYWKTPIRYRFAPVYTFIEETDLTNAYDKWNIIFGPYLGVSTYNDPWYLRSEIIGFKAALYRTQTFHGGIYTGYRNDYRDFAVGAEALWDHALGAHTQLGLNAEKSMGTVDSSGTQCDRAVLFGRYIFQYGSSLYLPPMHYVEAFASYQHDYLPFPVQPLFDGMRFDTQTQLGLHWALDYLTPYWDPEGGFRAEVTLAEGLPIFGVGESSHLASGQFSIVKGLPDWLGPLSETRVAARIYGAAALPSNGEFFTLGGSNLLRGYDLARRQGSQVWVASLEWRVPLIKNVTWDCCDHVLGIRNVSAAAFYDVGNAYISGHADGPVAHSVGAGLRIDMAWFSLIERTVLRIDMAKTVNDDTPVQFWVGLAHPF